MACVAIIDYKAGNNRSVAKAFEAVGGKPIITDKKEGLCKADRIVLPGVGAFGNGMLNLQRLNLLETLSKEVLCNKKPFLGICLGMQLLAKESEESPGVKGLGWLNTEVKKLRITGPGIKIPHMGWNELEPRRKDALFQGMGERPCFYFAHSYNMWCNSEPTVVLATSNYGGNFVTAVKKGNIFATQFHPEKSQENGLQLLKNFLKWDGKK